MQKNILIALAAIVLVVVGLISVQNMQPVSLTIFGSAMSVPVGLFSLLTCIAGLLSAGCAAGSVMAVRKAKEAVSDKNLVEWQRQDAKLELEKQSDREKQLEAKIATLEVALKAALDKRKKDPEAT